MRKIGKRKNINRLLCAAIAAAMLAPSAAAAADLTAAAAKDETVYVNLDYDGSVLQTIAVNSFRTGGNNSVFDYGDYKNIKNLSGTQTPTVKNGYIEWENLNTENFYYQGELKNTPAFPWDFNITYELNGSPAAAEQLIGADGRIKMTLTSTANGSVNSYFADNYMAQITVKLDTEKCKNIVAEDAMAATLGTTKQLTFMLLPKISKTYEITFNAVGFEADGITIAMIKISDGITGNIDNLKVSMAGMTNGISSLLSGENQLENGSFDLSRGISLLNSGAANLAQALPSVKSGMGEFGGGLSELSGGLIALSQGSALIRSGLFTLDSNSYAISKGIAQIREGLLKMIERKSDITAAVNELKQQQSSVSELSSGGQTLKNGYKQIENGLLAVKDKKNAISSSLSELQGTSTDLSALQGAAVSVSDGITLARNNLYAVASAASEPQKSQIKAIADGMADLTSTGTAGISAGLASAQTGMNKLYGAANSFGSAALQMAEVNQTMYINMCTLNTGLSSLLDGAGKLGALYDACMKFADGSLSLIDGAEQIYNGSAELDDGFAQYSSAVGQLAENYSEIDNGISDAHSGAETLKNGFDYLNSNSDTLFSAVDELTDNISKLDNGAENLYGGISQMANITDSAISGILGESGDLTELISMSESAHAVSFVCPGEIPVNSVQFAFKTPDLHIPEQQAPDEQPEQLNFWQKLIALFKFS